MRLRIATAFALLFFAFMAMLLVKVTRAIPAVVNSAKAFAFAHDAVDGDAAFSILEEFIAITPRNSGTDGASRAAQFIADRLSASGLIPGTDSFTDNAILFRNVVATVEGSGESCIVLVSHYDTKSGIAKTFTGANDSGSSTALLLHLATIFANSTNTSPDIVLAFVDGEECVTNYSSTDGLHGSRHLTAQLLAKYGTNGIKAAVILDMIGDKDLTITVPKNSSPQLTARLFDAAQTEGKRNLFSLYGPMLDDHAPFLVQGIPAIDIIDFHYGSSPRKNEYWHTKADTIDKLSAASLETVGRITVLLVNSLIAKPLE